MDYKKEGHDSWTLKLMRTRKRFWERDLVRSKLVDVLRTKFDVELEFDLDGDKHWWIVWHEADILILPDVEEMMTVCNFQGVGSLDRCKAIVKFSAWYVKNIGV